MRRILIRGNGVPQIDASQVNVHKKVENLRQERKEFGSRVDSVSCFSKADRVKAATHNNIRALLETHLGENLQGAQNTDNDNGAS
jgi:hypothetical protein